MKKSSFIFMIIIVFCGCFFACGKSEKTEQTTTMTREEMEEQAENVSILSVFPQSSNPVVIEETAKEYKGKVLSMTGSVGKIESDRITLNEVFDGGTGRSIGVKMSKEDIIKLERGQIITVIGILNDVSYDADKQIYGEMENAFLYKEEYSVEAEVAIEIVQGKEMGHFRTWVGRKDIYIEDRSKDIKTISTYGQSDYNYLELKGERIQEGDLYDISGKAKNDGVNDIIKFDYGVVIEKHK